MPRVAKTSGLYAWPLRTFEEIGLKLAEDCRSDSKSTWGHELLKHNADEVDGMKSILRPILFRH
jgi:hypothetical protein